MGAEGTSTCAPGKKAEFSVGVIGYGYWGPNIVRNFCGLDNACVKSVCDKNPQSLKKVKALYPSVTVTENDADILTAKDIDIVAIITPVSAHHELAKQALLNGKHVFVEKPFTATVAQAEELIEIAARKNLQIMVDHTFLFTGAVRKIKDLVDEGLLGRIYYYDSTRVNLGLFQHDVNVVWDLAPHDFSIMQHIITQKPSAVVATGSAHVNGKEDVAYVTVYFPDSVIAHFNVNWLSPVKVRTTLIGGANKMLLWDDVEPDEKIKIYDRGVTKGENPEGIHELLVSYRMGDIWAPRIDQVEALKLAAQNFVDAVVKDGELLTDGAAGLGVVRMLEAAQESLKSRGGMVYL